jgi:hypothetical protein
VEVREDGATIVQRAGVLEAEPPDLGFVCSVLRSASASNTGEDDGNDGAVVDEATNDSQMENNNV